MRRRGFTLIELLVVIAIIAILAAMLFPVFARARESARKIQCLSNVKNIAMAVQMYLGDYDRFPPKGNHDDALVAFCSTAPGGGRSARNCCHIACQANPYVRWPVVLDEYVKNKDVWRCPSAKVSFGPAFIVPQYTPVWWEYLKNTTGMWGAGSPAGGPCMEAYPPGWGGLVTDSIGQQRVAGTGQPIPGNFLTQTYGKAGFGHDTGSGGVEVTIGVNNQHPEEKLSQMNDAASFVVVGDAGYYPGKINTPDSIMFGVCGGQYDVPSLSCGFADWSNCPWTQQCGLSGDAPALWSDPNYRAKFPRHLGGANVGFADGHASWWPAELFMASAPYCDRCDATQPSGCAVRTQNRPLEGMCPPT